MSRRSSVSPRLRSVPPVLNPHPERGQVLELTRDFGGARIIVTPTEFRPGATSGAQWFNTPVAEHPLRQHDGSWSCIVLASTHDAYPAGGYDLAVSTCELRRARRVDLLAELIPGNWESQ